MLHGFGNDKHEWESTNDEGDGADKYHWNNHWFAKHGYYVINYTARGFSDDGAERGRTSRPRRSTRTAPKIPAHRGTLHLKSRDCEIRDTQWLAALVAKAYPDVDPSRVAVTGGSYGGIESWLQASQATLDLPELGRIRPCRCWISRSPCRSTRPPTSRTRWPPTVTAAARASTTCTSPRRARRTATAATATRSAPRRRAT